jgi:hypothetical protein
MNDNTILRIKVPAHLYESVKEQLTLKENKKQLQEKISGTEEELKDFYLRVKQIEGEGTDLESAVQYALFDLNNPDDAKELSSMNEAKKSGKAFSDWKVVKEKKLPKDGMKKMEEDMDVDMVKKEITEKQTEMDKKTRTLDELKAAKEKLEKKINEMEGGEEEMQISLNEWHGDPAAYELGLWAMKTFPDIASALKGAATGDGQEIVDLGLKIVGLATVGTISIGIGLGMAKDSIVSAAKKLKAAMSGVKEGEEIDPKLAQIAAKLKKKDLKEYEVIYVVRGGKCYRKDDEGNMDEVNMSKCR